MKKDFEAQRQEAFELYKNGLKYKEIASQVGVSLSAVKSWAARYWKAEKVATNKRKKVATNKGGAPKGNQNAAGSGGTGPPKNKNAEKHGFFSKWLPEETLQIIQETENKNPLDLLWDNIQLQYAAIIRAQKLMYVKDKKDKTVEKVEEKDGNVIGERWEVQQAWDKHANFMSAQSRAMKTLESMIRQYDEMLHKNWELVTDEQKARIASLKARIGENDSEISTDDGFLEALNSSAPSDWDGFGNEEN